MFPLGKYIPLLRSVALEPTNDCNIHCKMCYRGGREIGYMSWPVFLESIRQIRRIPTITGIGLNFAGEPLLHPRFLDMVGHINNTKSIIGKKYSVGFSTNGMLLTPLVFNLIKDKFDTLNVSLDGVGEVNDRQRLGADYNTITENLRYAIQSPRKRTKISVNMTVVDQTPEEISEFKEEWKGADIVRVHDVHDAEMKTLHNEDAYCHNLRHFAAIMWNGDLTTCCTDLRCTNKYGNIFDDGLLTFKSRRGPLCATCGLDK